MPIEKTTSGFTLPKVNTVDESQLIDYTDFNKLRDNLFTRIQGAVEQAFPIENDNYKLTVHDVKYEANDRYKKKEIKDSIMSNRSPSRKLTGVFELRDKEGNLVERSGRKTLMNVPYMTDAGTFIRNGTEYTIPKQMRLVPAIYTHITADGYPEAQFNVKQGTGTNFRTHMDTETSVFYLSSGGRKIPLYPVLKAIGVQDEQMINTWGKDIFDKNKVMEKSPHAQRWITDTIERVKKFNKYRVIPNENENENEVDETETDNNV